MKYKVGQIFYLVGAESARVIPFRIIEEVTRTTLSGVEKSFIAELPDEERTNIDVSKLKGAVFGNVRDLRSHMVENATFAIDSMIKSAKEISSKIYEQDFESNHENVDKAEENPEFENKKEINTQDEVPFQVLENQEIIPAQEDPLEGEPDKMVKIDMGGGIVANMKTSDLEKVSQA